MALVFTPTPDNPWGSTSMVGPGYDQYGNLVFRTYTGAAYLGTLGGATWTDEAAQIQSGQIQYAPLPPTSTLNDPTQNTTTWTDGPIAPTVGDPTTVVQEPAFNPYTDGPTSTLNDPMQNVYEPVDPNSPEYVAANTYDPWNTINNQVTYDMLTPELYPGQNITYGLPGTTINEWQEYEKFAREFLENSGGTIADLEMLINAIGGGGMPNYGWIATIGQDPELMSTWSTLTDEQKQVVANTIEANREKAGDGGLFDSFFSDVMQALSEMKGLQLLTAPVLAGGITALLNGGSFLAGMGNFAYDMTGGLLGTPYQAAIDISGMGIPELGLIADNATLVQAMDLGLSAGDLAAMGAVGSVEEATALYNAYQSGVDVNNLQWDSTTQQLTMDTSLDPNFDGIDANQAPTGGDTTLDPNYNDPFGNQPFDPSQTPTDPTLDPNYNDPFGDQPFDPNQTPTDPTLDPNYNDPFGDQPWDAPTNTPTTPNPIEEALKKMGLSGDQLIKAVGTVTSMLTGGSGTGGTGGTGGTTGNSILDTLLNLGGAYAQWDYADNMEDFFNKSIEAVRWKDPFWDNLAKQTGTYGVGGTAYGDAIANSVTREQAAQGYDFTGNMLHELAQGLNSASLEAINTFDRAARPTGNVYGDMFSSFGPAINGGLLNTLGALGNMTGGTTTTSGGINLGGIYDLGKSIWDDVFGGATQTDSGTWDLGDWGEWDPTVWL